MSGPTCDVCALPLHADDFYAPRCSFVCAERAAENAAEAFKAAWLEDAAGREFAWKEAAPS